ncbi:MAG: non-homologous end-joining DNA ligase [Bacillota bacterium]
MAIPVKSREIVKVQGQEVSISNLDKVFWEDEGYTKGHLINYYVQVFPYLVPHLAERPLVVTRYPSGASGKWFYQKNAPEGTPDWVNTYPWYSSHSDRYLNFVICDNLATMVWLANQACIELHPWMSRVGSLDRPDFVVFDLDPSEGATYKDVCDVAEVVRDVLRFLKLRFFLKTSGATGLHIFVPVINTYTYDELRDFVRRIAETVVSLVPDKATVVRKVKDRQGKVYVDYLQNIQGKTVCSTYSVRPHPGAPVSTPITWEEMRETRAGDFNIITVPPRLNRKGDMFAGVNTERQRIDEAWRRLNSNFRPRE